MIWRTGKMLCYGFVGIWLLASGVVTQSTFAQAAIWKTTLNVKDCSIAASVENAYDIDFGGFNANDVFTGSITNTGTITSGNATLHTSNVPSVPTPGYYLVVMDKCATSNRHADILASSMVDQNTANNITGTAIPAANLKLQNSGVVYFLDTTPFNSEISANAINTDTSFSTALQLIQRNAGTNPVGWKYWVKPSYKLIIPQFQQMDTYKGTITWTVI